MWRILAISRLGSCITSNNFNMVVNAPVNGWGVYFVM